jgi:glycerol-3-phosphate dehydrogenase
LLFDRYGTRAELVADFMSRGEDAALTTLPDYSRRELQFLAVKEHVIHLDDVILRRTLLAWLGRITTDTLMEIAESIAPVLGWSPERSQQEIERTIKLLQAKHGIALKVPVA